MGDPVPIVNGRFEITVGVQAAYHVGDATITGEFLPDGRVRGTYRVIHVEPSPDIPEEYLTREEHMERGEKVIYAFHRLGLQAGHYI